MKNIFIKTFGCQMNEYDSERLLTLLQKGFRSVADYKSADVVIVNTCSVREKAEKKLYDLLGRLRLFKKVKPHLIVGVVGCVAQQEGEKIIKRAPIVDFVVGTHNLSLVPALIAEAEEKKEKSVVVDYRGDWDLEVSDELGETPLEDYLDFNNINTFGNFYSKTRALVAIQRGCDKHCSYCVVPTTRGRELSRGMSEIEREIKFKVQNGASEVMLLGQTVNSYVRVGGLSCPDRISFEDLVRRVADIQGVQRIRFMSPHPQDVTDDFIKLFAEIPKLCPSIHLPMQSGNNRILKLMCRNYTVERYLEIVAKLRQVRPDIAITSDFIVGFPTETEDEFADTLAVIHDVQYSFLFSFKYSPRPNTLAIKKYSESEHIINDVAQHRLRQLQELQKELSLKFNQQFIGREMQVLVEKIVYCDNGKRVIRGRNPQNILVEIDSEQKEALLNATEITVCGESASPFAVRGKFVNH